MRVVSWSETAGEAADVDVEVEAVLDHLASASHGTRCGGRHRGIDDAVRADSQLTVGKPDVAPQSSQVANPSGAVQARIPGQPAQKRASARGPCSRDELESGRHRAPIGSAVARAFASMPRVKIG